MAATEIAALTTTTTTRAAARLLHISPPSGEGEIEVEVEVGGRGRPVVFIHGWAVDRRMWAHQLPSFRRAFTTVTYDRRGFGLSSAPADLDRELEDLDAILDQLELRTVGLVGMSQGGRIALRYALSRPGRVSGLVLQGPPLDDPPPPSSDASTLPLARYAALLRQGDRESLLRELASHPLMDVGPESLEVQAEIIAMLRDYRGEDLLAPGPATDSQRLVASDLVGVKAPTLVITGSQELLWLRAISDRIARNIRGARRRNIRGGRHFVNMTHIRGYNMVVSEFLRNTTRPWSERALGSV